MRKHYRHTKKGIAVTLLLCAGAVITMTSSKDNEKTPPPPADVWVQHPPVAERVFVQRQLSPDAQQGNVKLKSNLNPTTC